MSTVTGVRTAEDASASRRWLTALLACGIAVAVVQIAGDVVAAACYAGYSYVNQSVSELSAIGAPTRSFLVVVGVLYDAFVVAFAVGVWKAAGRMRAMSITAVLLAVFALNGLVWAFFPMQQRGSNMAATDIGHIVGGAVATQASRISQGLPTPWHELIERVSFYGPSLWILTLASVLLRVRQA
jgi:hypothetical protein